ncbi:hypothetical protein C5Y96_20960 [Blastopirellula marina]|uniref:Uncharacterized protein n=2 Tax=Pirellulales TaxID=2691354 RepID=A0A2S8F1F0_9BACT|nr:hypothetical protein C5Y96_20960 [Blastopirellula marina]RCS44285.1 hypothetical protein DTL36_21005 [Bremerella cremea]
MEPADQNNPFESPTAASDPSASLERVVHLARLGWLLPLIGIGLFVMILVTTRLEIPTSLNFMILIGILLCLVGGILFTVYGMFWSVAHRALLRHVMGGLAASFVLMTVVGGVILLLLFAVSSSYPG